MKRYITYLLTIMLIMLPTTFIAEEKISINSYNTVLEVSKTNKINVKEEVTFKVPSLGLLEFDRTLHTWTKYINKNNVEIEKRTDIENIYLDQDSSFTAEFNTKTIHLKSSNRLHESFETFTMSWIQNNSSDFNKGFDEFNYYLFEKNWNYNIDKHETIIKMPKEFDKNNVKIFCGTLRATDCTNRVEISKNNTELKITSKQPATSTMMISIVLPDKYFEESELKYGYITLLVIISSILIFIYTTIMFVVNRLDNRLPKKHKLRYLPPKKLSAAEVGYVNNEKENKYKLLASAIAEMCGKQYIKIYEKNDELYIMKLRSYRGENEVYKAILNNIPMTNIEYKIKDNIFIFESMIEDYTKYFENIFHYRIFRNKFNIVILAIATSFVQAALLHLSHKFIRDLNIKYNFLLYISVFAIYVGAIISFFDKKKNIYGHEQKLKTNQFKSTLKNMTKEDSINKVQEDKFYYYKIAPYAYALGIFDNFNNKFDTEYDRLFTMNDVIFNNVVNYKELEKILSKTLE